MAGERKPLSRYVAPRHWPVWIALGLLRLVCLLPHRAALAAGRGIGRLAHALAGERRGIVLRNLELCFPNLPAGERGRLARRHFEALGMSLIEYGLARWASDREHERLTDVVGLEHLESALETGRGIILLSAHFTPLEIAGRLLRTRTRPFAAVYRANRSAFLTEVLRSGRERSAALTIEKRDVRGIVRNLRRGMPIWYAPDQSYDRKGAVLVPFFGVPTMHTTATSTLARLGDALTVPFFIRRRDDGRYEITIHRPLEGFPSDDATADTRRYVALLEREILRSPEQYLWVHRKFKNLPEGYPDYYADLAESK